MKVTLDAIAELECLAEGFRDVAEHARGLYWRDRRRKSLLVKIETLLFAAEHVEGALNRLRTP